MLSEALCGASYKEIVDDYMTTYQNYYHLDKKTDSDKINIIIRDVLDPMITNTIGKEISIQEMRTFLPVRKNIS